MKFNKWTLGLAAVGVVSLTSAARADETNMVQTALSNTTISGYVDASAQFNPGGGGNNTPNYNFGNNANQINLNVVQVTLDKPLDEAPWASGYHVDLWMGPDATALGTSTSGGDVALRQAYIALRTPIGNGIDWKIGVFDTIIGYEGLTSGNNPNFSHSYGFNIEPTTHTGVLAVYHAFDWLTAQFGVADQSWGATSPTTSGYSARINGFPSNNAGNGALSTPTLMWGPTLTAPESWGWAKGGTLSFGTVNTSGSAGATSFYAGVTVPTPIAKLKFGASFDYLNVRNDVNGPGTNGGDTWNLAGYGTYAFNDKLSLNVRAEHLDGTAALNGGAYHNETQFGNNAADEITATLQYNLWSNVLTRLEVRMDHVEHGNGYASSSSSSGNGSDSETWLFAAQAIYTF